MINAITKKVETQGCDTDYLLKIELKSAILKLVFTIIRHEK